MYHSYGFEIMLDTNLFRQNAARIRADIIQMAHQGKAAHVASALSCVDILVSLYWEIMNLDPQKPQNPERDIFILSKGHAAMALYATLARRGIIPLEILKSFNQQGSKLQEHPGANSLPGVEAATGSLGHGLPIGLGMAYGTRLLQQPGKVFVLLSDGECNEGSVWEAAMLAPSQKLGNLCVIVDYNRWQATGRSNEVMALAPLAEKWSAFGWRSMEVDGHDPEQLTAGLQELEKDASRPLAIIAHTTKGRGISFMEDDNNWHYRIPTADEVKVCHQELGVAP